MEPLIIVKSPFSQRHDTGAGHAECYARIEGLDTVLSPYPYVMAPAAEYDVIALAHEEDYIDSIMMAVPEDGLRALSDGDTVLSPDSYEAALHAAGAGCHGVDLLIDKRARRVFCPIRPPGHHAEADKAMGFCIFNNAFIAARYAQEQHDISRIAIVDFDVHHGNGTQNMSMAHNRKNADRPIFYASSHVRDLFPHTGDPSDNSDYLVNVHLKHGAGGDVFYSAYVEKILPALNAFKPELLIISAGFDAHKDDPLGLCGLEADDFSWLTTKLCAAVSCSVLSILEGGYNIEALKKSVECHVKSLCA